MINRVLAALILLPWASTSYSSELIPNCFDDDLDNAAVSRTALEQFEKSETNQSREAVVEHVGRPSYTCGSGVSYDVYLLTDGRAVWIAYDSDGTQWAFIVDQDQSTRKTLFGNQDAT